jgi:hypothetical protein
MSRRAGLLDEKLEPQTSIVDCAHKDDVQREMRQIVKRQLCAADAATGALDALAEDVVKLLKSRRPR